ncbi:MAG: PilX N-terminal domain-containing pilus assembly protein, partial [candidate division Zixibacteria bacterium]|nr:PilX N-terminal domain-containing pilus assembly protein [candidate division Zixibacteria bacterium]
MKKILNSHRGFATILALIMLGMLTLIGLAALTTSDDEVTIAGNEWQEMRSFYAAEAGLERAAAQLQYIYDSTGLPPTIMPSGVDSINNCLVKYRT